MNIYKKERKCSVDYEKMRENTLFGSNKNGYGIECGRKKRKIEGEVMKRV